jgi:hypothetical protein
MSKIFKWFENYFKVKEVSYLTGKKVCVENALNL